LQTQIASRREETSSLRYITPFVAFLVFLVIDSWVPLDSLWGAPLRVVLLGAVCLICWPRELSLRPTKPLASIALGTLVFLLWIAPDFFFPTYRQHWLFSNSVIGHLHSSLQSSALHSPWILAWRSIRAAIIVPVAEELFWRAWLMRWLIHNDFQKVPLGAYTPFAFWITAILFAAEHGSYWDVGLLTGIIYNLWMIRTKSVANCILTHAVTNAILSGYVILVAQWQYWQ
jgi:CAAX protease family protein